LSLGVNLAVQNGCGTFGCIQIPKQPDTGLGADQDFINAIQSLAQNLPGSAYKAGVFVPLSTSGTVQSFLGSFLLKQAQPRNRGEAMGFIGFNRFTTPNVARAQARGMLNQRVIAMAPFCAAVSITDPTTGNAVEYAVSGEFLAAAMAGLYLANDVAQTLTLEKVVGFSRIVQAYDEPTMDAMAADGLTVLEDVGSGSLQVRHYKTTNPTSILYSEPTCTTIADYTRQQFRIGLQQFIGRKNTTSLMNTMTLCAASILQGEMADEIITNYQNLLVVADDADPTLIHVTAQVLPMFSVLYIDVVFTFRVSL